MILLEILLTALAFGAFAYAGALAAATYWGSVEPMDSAPASERPPVLLLVAGAAIVGCICVWRGVPAEALAIVAAMVAVLSAIWCVDVNRGIVPDVLTLLPLSALVIAGLLTGRWYVALAAVVPAIPFAVMAWRTEGMGLGWGDVKLAALGGALLGMQTAIPAFAVAAFGAIVVARIRRGTSEPIAFGPYLVSAIVLPLAFLARF